MCYFIWYPKNNLYSFFQIVCRFGFSRCIVFAMHLDIVYVYMHNNIYDPRKAKTIYIWKGWST
jgi:hypothetical protein